MLGTYNMLWKADRMVSLVHNNENVYYIGKNNKHRFFISNVEIDNPVRIIYPNKKFKEN